MASPKVSLHGRMLTGAIFVLIVSTILSNRAPVGSVAGQPTTDADIALTHATPLSLSVIYARGKKPEVIDLSHDAKDHVSFTLPSTWELREVRKGGLVHLSSTPSGLGFSLWKIPGGVTASFSIPEPLGHLTLHHLGSGSILVKTMQIDLQTEQTRKNSFLLENSQASAW